MNDDELEKTVLKNQNSFGVPDEQVFQMHDTDYLEVEILKLPITGLSTKFLTRICKPINMAQDTEILEIPWGAEADIEKKTKEAMLEKWKGFIKYTEEEVAELENEDVKKLLTKYYSISEVKIYEVEMVRKEK